ncbi:MAG: glutamine-hydrolyzing GMP synthase [Clostridia bacterium]|nr:glutamine-hydrolyzing GMP synthase [Clostridia bacterium]
MQKKGVLIVDFGGQFVQLIARRVREAKVYCEIVPYEKALEEAKKSKPIGIIISGGPNSVYLEGAPTLPKEFFDLGMPMLGLCYGAQLMAHVLGGTVSTPDRGENGRTPLVPGAKGSNTDGKYPGQLMEGITPDNCWMTHMDFIDQIPESFTITAHTGTCPAAVMESPKKKLYAAQFHPEVKHTPFGKELFENFLFKICGCEQDWILSDFTESKIEEIKSIVGDKKVLCALSGGVDSSVAAILTQKAIGDNLHCIFVDHGLLRKNEGDQVMDVYTKQFNLKVKRVNAAERFLGKLAGIAEPEQKRKIIGAEFIRVFEEESDKLFEQEGKFDFLLQGTIYPDVVESGTATSATIKSHHNVGGLPEDVEFELLEPLRMLFKDEVREVGEGLGMPAEIVWRQPFPGPGLAIRCLGEVREDKLSILRNADWIFREEIAKAGLEKEIWQYFAVLPDVYSVGVTGDFRTYDNVIALRAITSTDGMTADWARIPFDVLEEASKRIVNEVAGAGRIVYDITSKPPATVEWE